MTTPDHTTRRRIDLDAAREARAAELGEQPELVWGGKTYLLPFECPTEFLDRIVVDDFPGAMAALFADDDQGFDVADFIRRSSVPDLMELASGLAETYGLEGGPGNWRPSGASRSNTSRR